MASNSGAALAAGDKLSALGDAVLGHILSFLPSDAAARAAALSHRYRHVLAHVHTVSLAEPQPHVPDYDDDWSPGWRPVDHNAAPPAAPFVNVVSAALFARLRLHGGAAAVPLRVGFHVFRATDAALVDTWISYATWQAGDEGELHVDLRLSLGDDVCERGYSLRRAAVEDDGGGGGGREPQAVVPDWGGYNRFYNGYGTAATEDDDGEEEEDHASAMSEYIWYC